MLLVCESGTNEHKLDFVGELITTEYVSTSCSSKQMSTEQMSTDLYPANDVVTVR